VSSVAHAITIDSLPPVCLLSLFLFPKKLRQFAHPTNPFSLPRGGWIAGFIHRHPPSPLGHRWQLGLGHPSLSFLASELRDGPRKLTNHQKLHVTPTSKLAMCWPPRHRLLSQPAIYEGIWCKLTPPPYSPASPLQFGPRPRLGGDWEHPAGVSAAARSILPPRASQPGAGPHGQCGPYGLGRGQATAWAEARSHVVCSIRCGWLGVNNSDAENDWLGFFSRIPFWFNSLEIGSNF
jgi:hypothetical protein